MNRVWIALGAAVFAAAALLLWPTGPDSANPHWETATRSPLAVISFGAGRQVQASVASSPQQRGRGLKHWDFIAEGRGMLFVFPTAAQWGFWMQDTPVPLDIAWLDANGVIVDIQQMEPETTESYVPSADAVFALEVPQGWYGRNRIMVGGKADISFASGR